MGLRPEQPHHGLHHGCHGFPVGPSVPAIRPNVSNNAAGFFPVGLVRMLLNILERPVANPLWDTIIQMVMLPINWAVEKRQEGSGWVMNWMKTRASFEKTH